jgi:hypothetical protein
MTAFRSDNRLDDAPMRPLACDTCAASVLVRKSSREQTSLQWNAAARETCHELGNSPIPGPALAGCSRLAQTITEAVACGRLPVVQTQPA